MGESLWNKLHEAQEKTLLDEGIYDFTVNRIIDLRDDSILLGFEIADSKIAQRIYFDDRCTKARYLLASVGLLKDINSAWLTSELANTVGKSGRCIVGQYCVNGREGNNIDTFLAPWSDEKDLWWSYLVVKNGNKKCAGCGKAGTVAHHIYPKSVYPDKRYDVSNGQCLCWDCHNKWHDKYGTMAVGGPGL